MLHNYCTRHLLKMEKILMKQILRNCAIETENLYYEIALAESTRDKFAASGLEKLKISNRGSSLIF